MANHPKKYLKKRSASSCWDRSRVHGQCGITWEGATLGPHGPWGYAGYHHPHDGSMVLVYMLTWLGILMVNVTIYGIHGSYGIKHLRIYQTHKKKSCRLRSWTVVYRVSDLESRISTLESQISDLESRFLNFDSRILNLESRTSNLCSRISDLESPFSNLESRVRCQVHSELLTGTSEFWRTTSSSRSHSATPPCLK